MRPDRAISGHVFRVEGKRRSVWRAKYRLPDGRQVQRTIGRVWTERGRPPEGYFTKRTAQAWLRDVLDQAERGALAGMVRTGRTFCRRRGGVRPLPRRRPTAQAVDGPRRALGHPQSSSAAVW